MSEIRKRGFEIKKALPLLALAATGIGLALSANPDLIIALLRKEHRETFKNLIKGSNEREEMDIYMQYIPDGSEPVVAQWINDAMSGNSRRINRGQIKPHIVMADVVQGAYELAVSGRNLNSKRKHK